MRVTAAHAASVKATSQQPVKVTGDALKRAISILKDKLPDHLQSDGVVSLKGKPKFFATGQRGSYEVEGKIKVDALWGGAETRNFKAKIALAQGTLTGFKSW
jgi:hypothetical protein